MFFSRLICCVALTGLLVGATTDLTVSAEPTAAEKLVARDGVLVIAHRGDSSLAPENTTAAFQSAVRTGADLVELDYQHSADGRPVVFHDKELDRTTNATRVFGGKKIPLHSKKLQELKALDAGSWFDARFRGAKIPTLEESLQVIQAGSTTLVERKAGDAATCVRMLTRMKMLETVVVQSFDWDYVGACHRLAPKLVLAALGSKELTSEQLDQISDTGARVVAWSHKDIGEPECDAIHRRGWKVWVYTVNDPRRAQELIDAGVDGLITDSPAAMLKLVRSARQRESHPISPSSVPHSQRDRSAE